MKDNGGFRSSGEIEKYLKEGGVIGNFYGEEGEEEHINRFIIYDRNNDEYLYRREVYEDYSTEGTMRTKRLNPDEFHNWMTSLENHRDENFMFPAGLFHKNSGYSAGNAMEFV